MGKSSPVGSVYERYGTSGNYEAVNDQDTSQMLTVQTLGGWNEPGTADEFKAEISIDYWTVGVKDPGFEDKEWLLHGSGHRFEAGYSPGFRPG